MFRIYTGAAIIAAAFVLPTAANAEQRTAKVLYADLDLLTEHGVAALDQRIARSTRRFCKNTQPMRVDGYRAMTKCRTETKTAFDGMRTHVIAQAKQQAQPKLASAAK